MAAIKGAFTPKSVRTMACGKDGKIDGMKVDPGCPGLRYPAGTTAPCAPTCSATLAGKARPFTIGSIEE